MKFKKRAVLGVLLSTGLYLLDNLRERMPDNIDDIKGKARETYETASDRLGRATDVLRGKEDSQMLGKVGALLIGVGMRFSAAREAFASESGTGQPAPARAGLRSSRELVILFRVQSWRIGRCLEALGIG
jgi:hypothetical protein